MLETALIVSLVFGGWNWWAKEQAHERIDHLEGQITYYEQSFDELTEVNAANADTIDSLETANSACAERYRTLLEEVNAFRETRTVQDAEISRLADRLRDSAFARCRVPAGVSLEGIEAP